LILQDIIIKIYSTYGVEKNVQLGVKSQAERRQLLEEGKASGSQKGWLEQMSDALPVARTLVYLVRKLFLPLFPFPGALRKILLPASSGSQSLD
jgi:hypothetical protein